MNKFKYFFILLIAGTSLVSCDKDKDDPEIEPIRDYATQYATDKATIESYLNTHYIAVTEDMDVKIDSIDTPATQVPIMSYTANVGTSTFPQLKSKNVNLYGVDFELYYLVLREGIGESPINTDGVLTSYSGSYLTNVAAKGTYSAYVKSTSFEEIKYPQSFFDLTGVVTGWGETFPEFKTGTVDSNTNGTVTYRDFGAGVMFLPSALGYYTGNGSIPSYSPLVFSFKLYKVARLDHDSDGVLDMYEDINGDRYIYDFRNTTLYTNPPATNPDDTDGDKIPDVLDIDDDGDTFTTKLEITKPTSEVGPSKYYPYKAFTVANDPATPIDENKENSEPRGIPAFVKTEKDPVTGELKNVYDYETAGRLRVHLDKAHNTTKVTTP